MTDWEPYSLHELIDVIHGYAFEGEYFSGVPTSNILLTPGNFKIGGGFKDEKFRYFDGPIPKGYSLDHDDLVVTMTDLSKQGDTLGYPALIPLLENQTFLHNQRIGKIKILDENKILKKFLYYLLCTRDYRNEVLASATGTTVKHTAPDRIKLFSFLLPSIPEQKIIGNFLETFDKKISNNTVIIKTLKKISQTIFNYWFEDYNFPDKNGKPYKISKNKMIDSEFGKIPFGWKIKLLGDDVTFSYGKGLPARVRRTGIIPVYGSNGRIDWHDESFVKGPGVIIGRKGNAGTVNYSVSDFFPIDTTFFVVPNDSSNSIYYYYHELKNQGLDSISADSAVPGLNRHVAYLNKIVSPLPEIKEAFDKEVSELYDYMHILENESIKLEKMRDLFLEKLFSREITISPSKGD